MDLVDHKAYGYVDLTPRGQSLADKLTRRHETLYAFLKDVLGFEDDWSDQEACRLEHQIGDDVADRLLALTEYFSRDEQARHRWERMREKPREE